MFPGHQAVETTTWSGNQPSPSQSEKQWQQPLLALCYAARLGWVRGCTGELTAEGQRAQVHWATGQEQRKVQRMTSRTPDELQTPRRLNADCNPELANPPG